MCGIAGFFRPSGDADRCLEIVEGMADALVHRGPDGFGYHVDAGIGLASRRLSIIDVADGHQPVSSADGRYHLVYNGEVYNHTLLRSELAADGHNFTTRCDTEVVLAAFERFGPESVEKFNGMFAFAVWDRDARRLTLARDRLGIKPLYYYWDGEQLLFASEIKGLFAALPSKPAMNERAVWDYLTFRYSPMPDTVWRNVFKLPPGHVLTIDADAMSIELRRYWDVPVGRAKKQTSLAGSAEEFGGLFESAVQYRLVADVPVGVLLSGGLDSSLIAAVASRAHGHGLKTFSVAFEDDAENDETPFARRVASHLGVDHHEVRISADDFVASLPEFVRATDEPLADLASIPLHHVCKLAREHVKVVLSGEGSDEVFGGYTFDSVVRDWERAAQDRAATASRGPFWRRMFAKPRDWRDCLADLRNEDPPPFMTNYMTSQEKARLYPEGAGCRPSMDVVRAAIRRAGDGHPLEQLLYAYCQDWLVEDLLMKADKMSMATSLELRVPFLDHRLVEFAFSLPAHHRVGPNAKGDYVTKAVVREYAAGLLPRETIEREKRGFPVPVYAWLSGRLKDWAHDVLNAGDAAIYSHLERREVAEVLARGTRDEADTIARHRLWHLLVLETWMREWDVL